MIKRLIASAFAIVLAASLAACAPAGEEESSSIPVGESGESAVERTLYIGRGEEFQEVPHTFEEAPTPEQLIAAIGEETGWNLALAEPVYSGKGGMSVIFSKESALFTGLPDPQKAGYEVQDAQDLAYHILDSIQRTLQWNTIDPSLGDPTNLDVYFSAEGEEPLPLPGLALDEPYPGSAAWEEEETA